MAPACWLCGERAQKRNNGLCQHFCLGESCPPAPALTLMLDNSVSPYTTLVPFELLPPGWSSEAVSVRTLSKAP